MERSRCAQTARVSFAGLSKNNSFMSHKIGVKQPNSVSLAPRAAAVCCVYSVSLTGSAELRGRGSSSPLLLLGSLPRSGPPLIHGDSLLSSDSETPSCFLPPTSRKAFPLPADVCFPPSSLSALPPRGSERSCMMMNVVMADTPSFLFFSFLFVVLIVCK